MGNFGINVSHYPCEMRGMEDLLEGARYFIKGIVREAFEEMWEEKNYSPVKDTPLLTTEELCKRWNITPDTLHNREKKGNHWEKRKEQFSSMPTVSRQYLASSRQPLNSSSS